MNTKAIIEKLEELLIKSNEITTFYGKIIDANATFLHVHGIKASKEEIKTGQRLRDEFETLKGEYKKELSILQERGEKEEPKEQEMSDEGIWEAANHIDSHLFESFWDAYVAGAKWYRDHASQHKGYPEEFVEWAINHKELLIKFGKVDDLFKFWKER